MYIAGVGRTKFGISKKNLIELAQEAGELALKDALIGPKINYLLVSNFLGGVLNSQLHLGSAFSSLFSSRNIPSVRIEAASGSGGAAFHIATTLLKTHDCVMVVGVEKMSGAPLDLLTGALAMAASQQEQEAGLTFPAINALIAREYLSRYKLTHKSLEMVSYLAHKNANKNPMAQFYEKKITYKDIASAPMVASPLTLYDCCPKSDGAAAVILSRKKLSSRGVKILSSVLATDTLSILDRKDITKFDATTRAVNEALSEAHIPISKIDILEIHDAFTILYLCALENIGLAETGKAIKVVEKQLSGNFKVKINASGGLKADGHPIGATGLAQIHELVVQLRGEAGERQHPSPTYALSHSLGGVGGTVSISILQKP